MTQYKGKINLWGKTYDVEVIDGERYINGMTPEAFLETLTEDERTKSAIIGVQALKDEKRGVPLIKNRLRNIAESLTDEDVENFNVVKELNQL